MSSAGVREFLLAFADDEHLMGQQHTEWIGVAPFLEEDLAFSSIGQDELGHAALLYELVLELDGTEPTEEAVDALAYRREGDEYRSCHLVERHTLDWSETLVRHWVYDTLETMRWQSVADSSLPKLRAVAGRALQEEAFHRLHADALLDRLLPSPGARRRILDGLDAVRPLVPGLCEAVDGETEAIRLGVSARSIADILDPLNLAIEDRFLRSRGGEANAGSPMGERAVGVAADGERNDQRRRTSRSADFEPLMARMREVLDFDPEARW